MKKEIDREKHRGLYILKQWGFWVWLIVYLPGHFREKKYIKEQNKNGDKRIKRSKN
jgi:hypothetical protein